MPRGRGCRCEPMRLPSDTLSALRGGHLVPLAPPLFAVSSLALLVALNTAQNGGEHAPTPRIVAELASAEDVLRSCARKSDVVALWRSAGPVQPETVAGRELRGALLFRGVLAPASAVITHALFAPGSAWTGKAFGPLGEGLNTFANGMRRRCFTYAVQLSELDGKPALALTYRGRDGLFGGLLGMRDELRVLPGHPRILLGMGGMAVTGGVRNAAPFVLVLSGEAPQPSQAGI
ncbi:hypothetical protein T492DRAFT_964031 [Pavlovales sp. CCMP2436]|nr:hypothetical protein T492DRAFT_964031 [Pavlovales sp. CCMP2436]